MSAEDAAQRVAWDATRAAQYADEAAAEIYAARRGLDKSVHLAGEASVMLGRSGQMAEELTAQGRRLAGADDPRRPLLDAEEASTTTGQRAAASDDLLTELRGQLDATQEALRAGRRAVEQISRLPGERHELVDPLKDRLDGLEDALRYADKRATEVAGKLAFAQGNVGPLLQQAHTSVGLQATAETVQAVGQQADQNLAAAKAGLGEVGKRLEDASPHLAAAEGESIELEKALRAAANPTTAPQQRAPGSAFGEGSFRLHPGEAGRRNDYSR